MFDSSYYVNVIDKLNRNRLSIIEKHIEKMLCMAGYTYIEHPEEYNPYAYIDSITEFINTNNIVIDTKKIDRENTKYTMFKNGKEILFFIERKTEVVENCNYKIVTSLSDIQVVK